PSPYAMRPVLDLAGRKHIVFGSDFPYVHGDVLDFEIQQLDQLEVFDEATRSMVARQNALELFPRLARKTAPGQIGCTIPISKFAILCLIPSICLGGTRAIAESNAGSARMVEVGGGVSLRTIEAGKPGEGPTLVLIPGWSTGADIWKRQIDTFAKSYR